MRTTLLYFFSVCCVLYFACKSPAPPSPECETARSLYKTSVDSFNRGNYFFADSLARLAAGTALATGCSPLQWTKARTLMANAMQYEYGNERAADTLLRDLDYAEKNHPESAGIFHFWLGFVYQGDGEYWKALSHYEAAQQAHEKGKIPVVAGNVGRHLYKPLANIYTRLGEVEKSINLLRIALDSSLYQLDTVGIPEVCADLGRAYLSAGQIDSACAQFDRGYAFSLSVWGSAEHQDYIRGLLLSNWAKARLEAGDPDSARTLARRALGYDPWNPEACMTLGETEVLQGRLLRADAFFRQAENLHRDDSLSLDRELAKTLLWRAKLAAERNPAGEEALRMCNEALRLVLPGFKPSGVSDAPDPHSFYPENTILEALDLKSDILWRRYRHSRGDPRWLRLADTTTSLALRSADTLTATYGFESSVLYSLDYTRTLHERYFQILFERNDQLHEPEAPARLIAFSERSRALLLRQKLAREATLQDSRIPTGLREKERQLRSWIVEQKTLLAEMEADGAPPNDLNDQRLKIFKLEDERQRLLNSSPAYAKRDTVSVATLTAIRAFLPSDSAMLVEYFYSPETGALYQIGITRKEIRLAKNTLARKNIEAFLTFIRDKEQAEGREGDPEYLRAFVGEARMLYDSLLARVAGDLPLNELIIVPDGVLGALPFDLLLPADPAADQTSFRSLPYLFRDVAVRFASSATVLMQGDRRDGPSPSEGYFGIIPAYRDSGFFAPVLHGDSCVTSLRKMFQGQFLKGAAATATRFRDCAANCQILHFYGHGKANNTHPNLSYLALAPQNKGQKNDQPAIVYQRDSASLNMLAVRSELPPEEVRNVIFAQEIGMMQLNAALVVLSACETGIGKEVGGEGILSLARAFQYAGCPAAAMTLWSVDDEATAQLTQSFLRYIREGLRKDIALQRAKKDFLLDGKSASPFFWSGLVLTGDARPLENIGSGCYLAWGDTTISCGAVLGTSALLGIIFILIVVIFRRRRI